ncbi:MAG: trypsin-like peptidase domain-containing protein [Fimbriimonadaceae bacterium]
MKRNKSIYLALAAGVVLGAFGIATMGSWIRPALAQREAPLTNAKLVNSITSEEMATLRGLDKSFTSLAEYVTPSVVHIRSESKNGTDILGRRMGETGGVGTGVVFRSDGWIMTNDHVVNGFETVTVVLADGREFKGKVRRVEESDIAVVKIDATDLSAANFADSTSVHVGQFAMAVGSPLGLENSVTFGHISAIGRQNTIADTRLQAQGRFYPDLLQTDAAINQGNSGGPLFDIDGRVIGINTAIASPSGGSVGIGFAIPSNLARTLAETLIEKGKVVRGAIGLVPENLKPYELKEKNLDGGALAFQVEPDSPAGKAGIKKGDIIVRIGNFPVKSQMDLRLAMYRISPGTTTAVEIVRDGKRQTINVGVVDASTLKPAQRNPFSPGSPKTPEPNDPFGGEGFDFEQILPKDLPRGTNPNSSPKFERVGDVKLGVGIQEVTDELRKSRSIPSNIKGVMVMEVAPDSPAERAGLSNGVIIQELNGKTITSKEDIKAALSGLKWGSSARIKFGRYGANSQMTSELDIQF